MILLLDTDVLIDVALARAPHVDYSAKLLDKLESSPGSAFMAWHSISNFYYLVRPTVGPGNTKDFLRDLSRFVQVAPTTSQSLNQALRLDMADFEDCMQVAAAIAARADVIVTRNLRDYRKAPIEAALPENVLGEWFP